MPSYTSWLDYWKENMQALGFPIPDSFVANQAGVYGAIGALVAAIEKFGSRVTISELIGAGLLSEKYAVIGTLSAAAFVGAAIGSAAVATGRAISGGTSLADVLDFALSKRYLTPTTQRVLMSNPQIYQDSFPARSTYAKMERR